MQALRGASGVQAGPLARSAAVVEFGFRVAVVDAVVRVTTEGPITLDRGSEIIKRAAQAAVENSSRSVLFDIREAAFPHFLTDMIEYARLAPTLGLDRSFRIAFFGAKGELDLRFLESVAVNRGFQAKVFTDETQALSWLKSFSNA